jgi:OOP family OmpA-OmpF porin
MRKVILAALSLLILSATGHAQDEILPPNLVPNPGFEKQKKLPCGWIQNQKRFAKAIYDWTSPTGTHPDVFSTTKEENCWCNPKKASNGKILGPRTGIGMVGIKTFGKAKTETFWHEYIQVQLKEKLTVGEKYYVEFWVLRGNWAQRSSNNISALFTDTMINISSRLPLYYQTHIREDDLIVTDDFQWQKISGVIEAESEYQYLIIGNFCSDDKTQTERYDEGKRGAYYLIDDVRVHKADKDDKVSARPEICPPPPPLVEITEERITTEQHELIDLKYAVGKKVELRNIYFETAKAVLKPASKKELEKLVDLLYDYPNMHIEISGHTDNVGSDADNLALSEARAKAVVDYLIKKKKAYGERLTYKGYGETDAIESNDTDDGRARNRRVEFKVISNE